MNRIHSSAPAVEVCHTVEYDPEIDAPNEYFSVTACYDDGHENSGFIIVDTIGHLAALRDALSAYIDKFSSDNHKSCDNDNE